MRKLQDSILSLLIHMVILFNIERLDFSQNNEIINIDTSVYILTVLGIILILSVNWLKTIRPPILIALASGVFLLVKLLLLTRRPLVGGIYTYLSFTELGLFLVAVYLAHNLAINIKELELNAQVFSFANIRKLKRVQEAYKDIEAEIYRSRRFRRPLSVIVLEQDSNKLETNVKKLPLNVQRAMMEQYFLVILAKKLATQLRETDLLLENDKNGRLVILSPDTGITETQNLIKRLSALAQSTEFSINFGTATFPDHAMAFEELLAYAERNLQERANSQISIDVFKEV